MAVNPCRAELMQGIFAAVPDFGVDSAYTLFFTDLSLTSAKKSIYSTKPNNQAYQEQLIQEKSTRR
ncbi:hypothetical protein [Scandinavium goeteborgense]|uniref:hypothetical protein n=1 Tax=Scandinavium goeteborgense TaxID=1851514 RepID=UPI00105F1E4C|nr:hypothetical protein [Scandinavium goeteborgense]